MNSWDMLGYEVNIVCFLKIWWEKISFKPFIHKFEKCMDILIVISEAEISK